MDYAESRLYSPGDDVRRIDWRATARTGRAYTKLFQAERGSDLYAIVDQRAQMRFGTRAAFKSVVAAELATLAGWAAVEGGERFGALVAGIWQAHIRAGAAEGAVSALCAALATACDDAAPPEGTALDALAERAATDAPTGTRFVLVSDFSDDARTLERALDALHARGELVLLWIRDPLEARLPPPAHYPLTDGRKHVVLDAAHPAVRAAHARDAGARRAWLARVAARPGTLCREIATGEDLFAALERPFTSA